MLNLGSAEKSLQTDAKASAHGVCVAMLINVDSCEDLFNCNVSIIIFITRSNFQFICMSVV